MPANPNKQPRESQLDQINRLCEWYEKNKPTAGQRIDVAVSPRALAKALGFELPKDAQGKVIQKREWLHRGRMIVATGAPE